MGTVRQLANEIEAGLRAAHPTLRKTVIRTLALARCGLGKPRPRNTVELANLLPLDTERQDMQYRDSGCAAC
ncbi:MAG: hypothetical protein IPL99_15820 [Candidatus Competibacteraceae bacterium]|nr:hypothetical protein [Candidatus Competibacteraceae bacterium]